MKKKTVWVFFSYCVLILTALVLFLVFYPQNDDLKPVYEKPSTEETAPPSQINPDKPEEDNSQNDPTDNDNINSPSEENNPNNPSTDNNQDNTNPPTSNLPTELPNETYATSFSLNCSKKIMISKGSSAKFLSGFLIVEPIEFMDKVKVVVTNKTGEINGLTFSNNTLTAHIVGKYSVEFTLPKSSTKCFSATIEVTVVEKKQDNKVIQIKDNARIDKSINLTDIFNINNSYNNINVKSNSNFIYSNGIITPQIIGITNIDLSIVENYISYDYSFDFTIKDKPAYSFYVEGAIDNKLTINCEIGSCFDVYYEVYDKNSILVYQKLNVKIDNTNIAEKHEHFAPVITIKCLQKGSFNLTLSMDFEGVESLTINITII